MINQSPSVHWSGRSLLFLNPLTCDTHVERRDDGTARAIIGDNYRHDLIISDVAKLE